mgnify:CR=1 FL=1
MSFRISDGDFMHLPQRKLQRLKNYNYSQNNAYFITICTQNRLPLFGRIENSNLILNNAGLMVFNKIIIGKLIVMPNHLNAIMLIQDSGTAQGPFSTLGRIPTPPPIKSNKGLRPFFLLAAWTTIHMKSIFLFPVNEYNHRKLG